MATINKDDLYSIYVIDDHKHKDLTQRLNLQVKGIGTPIYSIDKIYSPDMYNSYTEYNNNNIAWMNARSNTAKSLLTEHPDNTNTYINLSYLYFNDTVWDINLNLIWYGKGYNTIDSYLFKLNTNTSPYEAMSLYIDTNNKLNFCIYISGVLNVITHPDVIDINQMYNINVYVSDVEFGIILDGNEVKQAYTGVMDKGISFFLNNNTDTYGLNGCISNFVCQNKTLPLNEGEGSIVYDSNGNIAGNIYNDNYDTWGYFRNEPAFDYISDLNDIIIDPPPLLITQPLIKNEVTNSWDYTEQEGNAQVIKSTSKIGKEYGFIIYDYDDYYSRTSRNYTDVNYNTGDRITARWFIKKEKSAEGNALLRFDVTSDTEANVIVLSFNPITGTYLISYEDFTDTAYEIVDKDTYWIVLMSGIIGFNAIKTDMACSPVYYETDSLVDDNGENVGSITFYNLEQFRNKTLKEVKNLSLCYNEQTLNTYNKISSSFDTSNLYKDSMAISMKVNPNGSGQILGEFISFDIDTEMFTLTDNTSSVSLQGYNAEINDVGMVCHTAENSLELFVNGTWEKTSYSGNLPVSTFNLGENNTSITGFYDIKIWHDMSLQDLKNKIGEDTSKPSFISKWKTTSTNQLLTLPANSTSNNFFIDWGDGSEVENITTDYPTHVYASPGEYIITIDGVCPSWYQNSTGDYDKILEVMQLGDVEWTSFERAFEGCNNLTTFNAHPCITENVTNMSYMFKSSGISNIDLEGIDTSNVTNMSGMFRNIDNLTLPPDVSSFDTSKVTDMSDMFYIIYNITTPPDVSGFDTSNVTNMGNMFSSMYDITTPPDVSGFDTSNVTNMSGMFGVIYNITTPPDVSGFDTSNVTNMSSMFSIMRNITTPPDVSGFDTSNVIYMTNMFNNMQNLTSPPDTSGFDTSNVTHMSYMFEYMKNITTPPDVSNFDTSNVTYMFSMFLAMQNLTTPPDTSGFDTSNVINMARMFEAMYNTTTPPNVSGFNTSNCTDMNMMFNDMMTITTPPDVSGFDTSKVTNMSDMFSTMHSLTSLPDVSGFDTSSCTNMSSMFQSMSGMPNVSSFDTSNVTDMSGMFYQITNMTNNVSLSSWDTSKVEYMDNMFHNIDGVYELTNLGLENWNVNSLSTADYMFGTARIAQADYDKILENWSYQSVVQNIDIDFGKSKFTEGSAGETGRNVLINNNGWNITDAGPEYAFITVWNIPSDNYTLTLPANNSGNNFRIDWGDGNIEYITSANPTHNYVTAGSYTISITGKVETWDQNTASADKLLITRVNQLGDVEWWNLHQAFNECENIDYFKASPCNTSNVTDMFCMFRNWTTTVNTPDLAGLDTGNVTNMSSMFSNMESITTPPDVSGFDTSNCTNMSWMLNNMPLITDPPDVSNFDTSNVTDMSSMLRSLKDITTPPDVSNFNTSKVTNINSMFNNMQNLTSPPDTSGFDTSNCTNINNMFQSLTNITSPPDVSGFDTSKATNMSYMFYQMYVTSTPPDVSGFDTSNVTNMEGLFRDMKAITDPPDVSNWNTSNVTNMSSLFRNIRLVTSAPDVSNWDVSKVTDMRYILRDMNECLSAPDVSNWNTTSLTLMSDAFGNNFKMPTIPDVSGWNTSNVTNFWQVFVNNRAATTVPDLSNWDTSKVTNMGYMFHDCNSLPDIDNSGMENWDISSLTTATSFMRYTKLTTSVYDTLLNNWDNQTVQQNVDIHFGNSQYSSVGEPHRDNLVNVDGWTIDDGGYIDNSFITVWNISSDNYTLTLPADNSNNNFNIDWGDGNTETITSANPTHVYATAGTYTISIDGTVGTWNQNTASADKLKIIRVEQLGYCGWTNLYQAFNECYNIEYFKASPCDTSNVTSMASMFRNWTNTFTTPPDVTGVDTSNVTNMASMFSNMYKVTSPPDVSGFDTSNVTNMSYMFNSMNDTTTPPNVSNFDTSNVTNMKNMFNSMLEITTPPDVSNWDVGKVTNMGHMFDFMHKLFTTPNASNWDTSNVTDMSGMFLSCSLNFSSVGMENWNVTSLITAVDFLNTSVLNTSVYDTLLENWSNQTVQPNVSIHFGDSVPSSEGIPYRNILVDSPNNWFILDNGN